MQGLTPLVRNLIILNGLVYIAQMLLPLDFTRTIDGQDVHLMLTQMISLWGISSPFFQPYQFFTYMFAHGGFFHIFFNMIVLASFGPVLETYWGEKKFLICYLVTGIGAGIIYTVVHYYLGSSDVPMLGASGAIYGLLMAFGMVFPNLEVGLLFVPIPIKAKYLVFVVGLITFLLDSSGNVAHLAHFGGVVVAYLLVSFWNKSGTKFNY